MGTPAHSLQGTCGQNHRPGIPSSPRCPQAVSGDSTPCRPSPWVGRTPPRLKHGVSPGPEPHPPQIRPVGLTCQVTGGGPGHHCRLPHQASQPFSDPRAPPVQPVPQATSCIECTHITCSLRSVRPGLVPASQNPSGPDQPYPQAPTSPQPQLLLLFQPPCLSITPRKVIPPPQSQKVTQNVRRVAKAQPRMCERLLLLVIFAMICLIFIFVSHLSRYTDEVPDVRATFSPAAEEQFSAGDVWQ